MHATGVFPPPGAPPMSSALFLLAFAYRFVIDVAGSLLTARLAPRRPMWHALALGSIGLGLSVAGAIAMGERGPGLVRQRARSERAAVCLAGRPAVRARVIFAPARSHGSTPPGTTRKLGWTLGRLTRSRSQRVRLRSHSFRRRWLHSRPTWPACTGRRRSGRGGPSMRPSKA
jgi:hypothetical protein